MNQPTLVNVTSDTDHVNLAQSSDNVSSALPPVVTAGKCTDVLVISAITTWEVGAIFNARTCKAIQNGTYSTAL